MLLRNAIFFCAPLLLPGRILWALDPGRSITQYMQTNWVVEDGLPQSAVVAIQQTRDGYLWIGTVEGLARFDGIKFTIYDKINTPSLQSHYITSIYEDRSGTLRFGSYSGDLYSMKAKNVRRHPLFRSPVNFLFEDSTGMLWAGSKEGVKCLRNDQPVSCPVTVKGEARALVEHRGRFWIATSEGLVEFHNGKTTVSTTREGLPTDQITSLMMDTQGVHSIRSNEAGLILWDGQKKILANKRNKPFLGGRTSVPAIGLFPGDGGDGSGVSGVSRLVISSNTIVVHGIGYQA